MADFYPLGETFGWGPSMGLVAIRFWALTLCMPSAGNTLGKKSGPKRRNGRNGRRNGESEG